MDENWQVVRLRPFNNPVLNRSIVIILFLKVCDNMKHILILGCLLLAVGCTSVDPKPYRPKGGREKAAFTRVDRLIGPKLVLEDFETHRDVEVAWAGIIEDIQYNETERTIQVAFKVGHRGFDWIDHGGGRPYQLSGVGEGHFVAGWVVPKPASINYLKALAGAGDMIVIYGKPYQVKDDVIQLAATALRIVDDGDFEVVQVLPVAGEGTDVLAD
jgi:hypothetical protein